MKIKDKVKDSNLVQTIIEILPLAIIAPMTLYIIFTVHIVWVQILSTVLCVVFSVGWTIWRIVKIMHTSTQMQMRMNTEYLIETLKQKHSDQQLGDLMEINVDEIKDDCNESESENENES